MLTVISPAKRLDYATPPPGRKHSEPEFAPAAAELVELLATRKPAALGKLMGISAKLASQNHERYVAWSATPAPERVRPAIFAFVGDVYLGLAARSLSARELDYAQSRLRILSGLYGLLRPLDGIQPYRLEMGTALRNPRGPDLYAYWGSTQARALNALARTARTRYLVNLASNEYFEAVDSAALDLEVITPAFKEGKGGEYRMLSFFAKKARGMMARYIIQRRCKKPRDLLDFDSDGYRYNVALSTPAAPVFTRGGKA